MIDNLTVKQLTVLIEAGRKRGYDTVQTVKNIDYLMEMYYYDLSLDEAYRECLKYLNNMKQRG